MILNLLRPSPSIKAPSRRYHYVHKVTSAPKEKLARSHDIQPTHNLIKDDGFNYLETRQRLSGISRDHKRIRPLIDDIKDKFKEKFGKDIPAIPSQDETKQLCQILTNGLYETYGPYDEAFVIAENAKDEGKHLSILEKKLINDRHPPLYPLKEIPKTQFACFETSVLTSYLLRKLTKLKPEILFFEGQTQTETESKKTEHAIVVIPKYNMILETTDPDTKPAVQKHDFKSELERTGRTTLKFEDLSYQIPPLSAISNFTNNISLTLKNALRNLHYAQPTSSHRFTGIFTHHLGQLLDRIMR